MNQEVRILTLHPQGKKGVYILKRRYSIIKDFIIHTIENYGDITFRELNKLAVEKLTHSI